MVLGFAIVDGDTRARLNLVQHLGQIHALGLPMGDGFFQVNLVHPADHFGHGAEAQLGHDLAQLFRDKEEVVDHMLGRAGETLAQDGVLRRHAHRAGVEMAFAHHDAARRDQGRGGEAKFVGPQQGADGNVAARAKAAIDLHGNAAAQAVQHQCLLGFGQANFPGTAGMGERSERRGAGAAFKAGNGDMVGTALGDTRRHGADAHFRHQLDRNTRFLVGAFQVADQLRQIFDGINVVMRRRRDETHARSGMAHLGDGGIHLVAGQLAAFAGLGALGHLDLDVVGIDQIFGGDAEAARGDLLDLGAHGIAVRHGDETVGFFAAFAGIGTAADAVHGDGQGGMRFSGDGAEAHGAGRETLDDINGRFDFIQRHAFAGLELHQAAQGEKALILFVDALGEELVFGRIVAAHGMLKPRNAFRRPGMILAAQAVGIIAAHIQHAAIDGIVAIGVAMAADAFLAHFLQADAFNGGGGAGEEFLDKIGGEPHRVENLGAAIGLVGRDAHLGHHFQNALAHRLDVILLHFVRLERQALANADLFQGFKGDIGIDRFGTITGQGAEMMHFSRFAGFHDKPRLHAQALADQMVMDGGGGQQRRHRHAVRRSGAIRQNENVVVGQHRIGGVVADAQQGVRQAVSALNGGPGAVNRGSAEGAIHQFRNGADFFHIGIGQHRLVHFQALVVARFAAQQIGARPDHRNQAHHQFFADRINRRIGDLGEVLLEVIVQQLGFVGEHGQRRVHAHRAQRIIANLRHRLQEELQIFLGVAEGLLLIEEQARIIGLGAVIFRKVGQFFQLELRRLQPFLIGFGLAECFLDLFVFNDAAFFQINQQHLAGLEAPFALDLFFRHRQHAGFRRQDHQIIIGDDVAGGAQAIAVERRADLAAIGKGDGGGAVPRLQQGGVIFVEGLALGIHALVAGPGFGDQHHHGMGQRIAARHQHFQRIVETGGVGLAVRNQRPHLVEIGTQQVRLHGAAACIHPVDVAAHRVDFAIMGDEAIGMRQLPAWESVGRETLMHQRNGRSGERVLQIQIEAADIMRQQQALIDHGAGGEAGHVKLRDGGLLVLLRQRLQRILCLLADGEELTLERVLVLGVRTHGDDGLADQRHLFQHGLAQARGVGRHIAPAQKLLAFDLDEMLKLLDDDFARLGFARQETHADGIFARRRQGDAGVLGPFAQQRIRIRMPAPSPTSGSAPTAPRWSRLIRSCSPWPTIWWDFWPLMLATKPTPHESCSLRGSYRPCFGGRLISP